MSEPQSKYTWIYGTIGSPTDGRWEQEKFISS